MRRKLVIPLLQTRKPQPESKPLGRVGLPSRIPGSDPGDSGARCLGPPRASRRLLTSSASSQEVERHCQVPSEAALLPRPSASPTLRRVRCRRGHHGFAGLELSRAAASWRGAPGRPGSGGGGSSARDSSPSVHASPAGALALASVRRVPGVPYFGPQAPPLDRGDLGGVQRPANGRARCGQRPGACAPPPLLIG